MQAEDSIHKKLRPFSNVLRYQVIDIRTSAAEQSNNICCSVVPHTRNDPTPIYRAGGSEKGWRPSSEQSHKPAEVARYLPLFARGFLHKSDEFVFMHLAELCEIMPTAESHWQYGNDDPH